MARVKITSRQLKKSGLTFREIAKRLDIVEATLYLWVKKGVPFYATYGVEAVCGIEIIPENKRYRGGEKIEE